MKYLSLLSVFLLILSCSEPSEHEPTETRSIPHADSTSGIDFKVDTTWKDVKDYTF